MRSFIHPPLSAETKPPAKWYEYPSDLPHSVSVCALTSTQSIKRTATAITVRMNVLPCMAQLVTEYIAESSHIAPTFVNIRSRWKMDVVSRNAYLQIQGLPCMT